MKAFIDLRARLLFLSNAGGKLAMLEIVTDPTVKAQIEDKVIEQLQRGERGDKQKLPNYSPVSVAKFNKPSGPIKLYDQGDFYRGISVDVDKQGFQPYGTDSKTAMLEGRYGSEILDLQERSLEELTREVFLPIFREKALKMIVG